MLTLRQLSAVSPEECFATMNQDYRSLFSCSDYCRQFLKFAFKGAVFNYLVLPFGLSLTPFKCDEVAVAHLRDRGGHCNSKLQRASNSAAFVSSVAHLGTGLFSKSTEKSADIKLAVVFSQSENMLPAERICQSAEWPCFTAASRKILVGCKLCFLMILQLVGMMASMIAGVSLSFESLPLLYTQVV